MRPTSQASRIRRTWRNESLNETRIARLRLGVRIAFTAFTLLLLWLFGQLLFRPLFHPKLQLAVLTASIAAEPDAAPIAFLRDDALKFLSSQSSFEAAEAAGKFFILESPTQARKALTSIAARAENSSDCLMVHICAHPMIQDGQPYLRCDNFAMTNPSQGMLALAEIIDLLSESMAGSIVLLLDTARSANIRESAAQDEFLISLQSLVRSRNTNSLVIISASAPGERSYVSTKHRGSLFLQAAVDGLSGLADLNGDRTITLDEFYQYVSLVTGSLVSTESQGVAQQTPQLYGGNRITNTELGRRVISSAPAQGSLVSRVTAMFGSSKTAAANTNADPAGDAAGAAVTQTANADSNSEEEENKSALMRYWERKSEDAKEAAEDEFYDAISALPVSVRRKIRNTVGVGSIKDSELNNTKDKPTPAAGDDKQATAPSADAAPASDAAAGADEKSAGDAQSQSDQDKSSETSDTNSAAMELPYLSSLGADQSLLQMVQLAWQITENIEGATNTGRNPVNDAPQAWAHWIEYLHGVEQVARTAGFVDEQKLRVELTAEIFAAMQLLAGQPALTGKWMRSVSEQLPILPIDPKLNHSIGMVEAFVAAGGPSMATDLAQKIKEFDTFLTARDPNEFAKWIEASRQSAAFSLFEFQLAGDLNDLGNVAWPTFQQTLLATRQFERLAVDPLTRNQYLSAQLQQAQRELLDAVRCLQDQLAPNWAELALTKLSIVSRTLAKLQSERDTLSRALNLRNKLLLDMSSIFQWRASAIQRMGMVEIDPLVSQLLTRLVALNDQLDQFDLVRPSEVLPNLTATEHVASQIDQSWKSLAESLLANKADSQVAKSWAIDLLLSTSMVRDGHRIKLLNLKPSSNSGYVPMQLPPGSATGGSANVALAESRQLRQQELMKQWESINQASGQTADMQESGLYVQRKLALSKRQVVDCIQQRMRLLNLAMDDALPPERAQLRGYFERLNQLAGGMSSESTSDRSLPVLRSSRLSARSVSSLSLIAEPTVTAELRVRNMATPMDNVWIVVDYDAQAIAIESLGNLKFTTVAALNRSLGDALDTAEQSLVQNLQQSNSANDPGVLVATVRLDELKAAQLYPPRPLADVLRPTTDLGSGQELVIPFQVKRLGNGGDHSKIVWKIISGDEYWRHEIAIQLPTTEKLRLVVDGSQSDWTETPEGIIVHPLPNRPSEFRIGLSSLGGTSRELSVELLALLQRNSIALPDGFVDDTTSREIAGRLGATKLIANAPLVAVASSDKPAWLTLLPEGLPALPVAPDAVKSDAPIGKEIKGADIRYGVVMVLTDTATKQRMWRRIDCQVKHPRSYVLPEISYDSLAQRVTIRMRPKPDFDVGNRTIAITGKVMGSVPSGTEQLLEGVINSRDGIKLFCSLPATAPPEMSFAIDVDDFPRAFVFTVPCWRTQNNIPYQAASERVTILNPASGKSISSNSDPITAELQVDAIVGAFASGRDAVEIGWDLDRDREFRQENTLRITTDRDVDVKLDPPKGDRLTWRTKVSDLKTVMPPPPINNGRVNLLARLSAAGQVAWSTPVEIVVDNDPPVLESIGVLPASVLAQGTEVEVRVVASDAELSGIETVQLMRDVKLRGQWEPGGAIIVCERSDDGEWVGKIPTAALPTGRVNYLVRATDVVGNHSQLGKFSIEVIATEAWQARLAQIGQEVSGTVTYADAPLTDAKITLVDEKGNVAYTASTNAQGMFKLAKVAIGKYKVNTIGVAKNRPRISESQVEVTPQASAPIRLRIQAK